MELHRHQVFTTASAFSLLVLIITAALPAAILTQDRAGITVRRELCVKAPNKQMAETL